MANVIHKTIVRSEAVHPAWYVGSVDPGAVGAGALWLDTTLGETMEEGAIVKERNELDTGWTVRVDLFPALGGGIVTLTPSGGNVTWPVTGLVEQVAEVAWDASGALTITGATVGFRGCLLLTEAGNGLTITLPADSIVASDGQGAIAVTGATGGKQKWTCLWDGTNWWWEHGDNYTEAP
jgi:hypothetical protein